MTPHTITDAERQATAWMLRYATPLGTTSVSFLVLVPHDGMPEDYGHYRLVSMGLSEGELSTTQRLRVTGLSDADLLRVLACESDIECDERRESYRREVDGPPNDDHLHRFYGAGTPQTDIERLQAAFKALQETKG